MLKKFLLFFGLLVFMLAGGSGCSKDIAPEISPPDQPITELVSKTYTDKELSEIRSFCGSIDLLNEGYPIECIRETDHGYRVSYLGKNAVAMVLFDLSGKHLTGQIIRSHCTKADFANLKIGNTLDDTMAIDPEGYYPFLLTGRNDYERISTHCTTDGYCFSIHYDRNNRITSIEQELV